MARNVKKVKVHTKAKRSKKFHAILWSSIIAGLAIIALVIVLIVINVNKEKPKHNEFSDIYEETSITYKGLKKQIEKDQYEHMFIYYYDSSLNKDDSYGESQTILKVRELYKSYQSYVNNGGEDVVFFILKTDEDGNAKALTDEALGTISSSNQISYLYGGTPCDYKYGREESDKNCGDDLAGNSDSNLTSATNFINELKAMIKSE